jgi:hypothetical protein
VSAVVVFRNERREMQRLLTVTEIYLVDPDGTSVVHDSDIGRRHL